MNKYGGFPVVVLFLIVLLYPAVAPAQSQAEMNDQAEQDFNKSDAQLNVVYKKLVAKLDDAESVQKLKAAQRAWLAFRDAEAEFEADKDARGGSLYPLLYAGTEKSLTDKRIAELQAIIDADAGK